MATTTSKPRINKRQIFNASYRAGRAADALRYLDAAVGCAEEAGLTRGEQDCGMIRDALTRQLERDCEICGFDSTDFYSKD